MRKTHHKRRRVAVITGTRAEYGLLKSVMHAIAAQPPLELQLVVTGIHLLKHFGHTITDIVRDGFRIDARVPMQRGDDGPLDQAQGLARGVAGLANFFERAQTDIALVLGDRIEATAGALAAVTTGRTLAHLQGGDLAPGDFDDRLRDAITALADLHFPATPRSARRLVRLGVPRNRIFVVGAPGLDRLREILNDAGPREKAPPGGSARRDPGRHTQALSCTAPDGARRPGGLGPGRPGHPPTALVVFHASGRPAQVEEHALTILLDTLAAAGLRRQIIYPNTDRGHIGVIRAIKRHARAHADEVRVFRSLPRDEYLRALLAADLLVGNSSSGIIEAPLAGTPSIDIGQRQQGREPGGPSVLRCRETPAALRVALRRALGMRVRVGGGSVYGDGRSGKRIARILARVRLGQ